MNLSVNDWPELAVAIVPYQRYGETFKIVEALYKGTLFPELYRPYDPGRGCGHS